MDNKFVQSSGGGGVADPSLVGDRELILIHRVPLNIQSNSSIEQGLEEYSVSNSSIGRTGVNIIIHSWTVSLIQLVREGVRGRGGEEEWEEEGGMKVGNK